MYCTDPFRRRRAPAGEF